MGQFKQKWSCVLLFLQFVYNLWGSFRGDVCVFIETSSLAMRHQLCFSYFVTLLFFNSGAKRSGIF